MTQQKPIQLTEEQRPFIDSLRGGRDIGWVLIDAKGKLIPNPKKFSITECRSEFHDHRKRPI